jgi:hypothetical protein
MDDIAIGFQSLPRSFRAKFLVKFWGEVRLSVMAVIGFTAAMLAE